MHRRFISFSGAGARACCHDATAGFGSSISSLTTMKPNGFEPRE
jgi:hypothetical protein